MTAIEFPAVSAAIRVRDWAEAERQARLHLSTHPHREDLLLMLAISLQMQDKIADAVAAHAQLTQRFPQNATYWGNYATALREAGSFDEAAAAHQRALQLAPDDAHELTNYGLLQLHRRDYQAARATLSRALALNPGSPEARIRAARAADACREYDEAQELLAPWRNWLPLEDDLQLELGDLLLSSGDGFDAIAVLEQLVQRAPANVSALVHLASAYERLNKLPQAQATMARIQPLRAGIGPAQAAELTHVLAKIAQRAGDLDDARVLLEGAGPRGEGDFAHYFSLADIHARLGNVEQTMQALESAHALQQVELKQAVPARFQPGASVLPAADRCIERADYERWPTLIAPEQGQSPVFIVGFPRSGTTLLEQMLDAHPHLQSMDENPFLNKLCDQLADQGIMVPYDIHRLGQRDCDELRRRYLTMVCRTVPRQWDAQIVDKNPLNMLWLPFIHRLFPNARYILALRHPCDVILSCYMQNFRSNMLAAACTTLERLATAYVASMRNWLHHVEVLQPAVLNVRNEELIADPTAQAQRIGAFLGLEDASPLLRFDQHARDKGFIATPSYTQVIQPINAKGMNRWHRYRAYLDPVLPILEPMLRHWEYPTAPAPEAAIRASA
ncbi:MAG: sulfotransferase family protein [Lysobacteraceae bacterium]|nr:MAG: sulfotransferase family protein [Xanthomonadaceae bacterium]